MPPAIRAARRRYLISFARLYGWHPRDIGRLYVWEFWSFVADIERELARRQQE